MFGYVAFVHVLDTSRDKLSPWAHKCIFLGYPHIQKGYRCYNHEFRHSFVSADFAFFASTSFFSSPSQGMSSNLIVRGLPLSSLGHSPRSLASHSNPPLQVYQQSRDRRVVSYGPNATSSSFEVPAPFVPILETDDLPIALRQGKCTCTQNPIANFVSYHCVFTLSAFICLYCPLFPSLHLISRPCLHLDRLDGDMLWVRKCVLFTRIKPRSSLLLTLERKKKKNCRLSLGIHHQVPP